MDELNSDLEKEDARSAAFYREQGKVLFFDPDVSPKQKKEGLRLLMKAQLKDDPEAIYLIARFLVEGMVKTNSGSSLEHGLALMLKAANMGWTQARSFLDVYCDDRYRSRAHASECNSRIEGPLQDFDGRIIKISRKGLLTPIDAELIYEEGKNILMLSANIQFIYGENSINWQNYEKAVLEGFLQWQRNYQVFGGQQLEVRIHLTTEERLFDNVFVVQMGQDFVDSVSGVLGTMGTKKKKAEIQDLLKNHRSFASMGLKWSSTSRKIICMQSRNRKFDDYEELKAVAKHEFGHALGLGDLYNSPVDELPGVEKGSYEEIDCYYISNKMYHLVMCDHHAPISNNDIEMVVLAFRENEMQNYQYGKKAKKISDALGRGN